MYQRKCGWWCEKKPLFYTSIQFTVKENDPLGTIFKGVGEGGHYEIPVIAFFTVTTRNFRFKCKSWFLSETETEQIICCLALAAPRRFTQLYE